MKLYWSKAEMKWVERPTQTAPQVHLQSDWEPITSPITDEVITGRAAYMSHLREHGCHIKEPGSDAPKSGPDRAQIRADVKQSLRELGVIG